MSDATKLVNDIIAWVHGDKKPPGVTAIDADAMKLINAVEKVAAGVSGSSKDVPGLVADVGALVAEATALAASKGLDLPALIAGAATLEKTAQDFARAVADFKAAAAVVAAAPPKA